MITTTATIGVETNSHDEQYMISVYVVKIYFIILRSTTIQFWAHVALMVDSRKYPIHVAAHSVVAILVAFDFYSILGTWAPQNQGTVYLESPILRI